MNIEVLKAIFQPEILVLCFLGTLLGIVLGAIPGLNGTIGIALLLPITFRMDPAAGILMLGGIYMGTMYGGSITAILINVPGDVPATCTAFDGYPLAKAGRAKEALYYSVFSSMWGGLFGILTLILFAPQLARIALKFGPPEMFICSLCGLAVVAALTGKNRFKAFFSTGVGVLIAMIGIDPITGVSRMTFGLTQAKTGISVVPICLALFCFAEMYDNITNKVSEKVYYADQKITRRFVIVDILKRTKLLLKSCCIGTVIGILPGIGAAMAIFLSYGEAKRTSKNPELFGRGSVEGIIAAESSNNAVVGGALVPMLALGIPGAATAAMVASALTMHGLQMGPALFTQSADVAYTFMYGMLLTVAFMAIIGGFGVKYFSYILKAKMEYILPVVIVFATFGSYAVNNNLFETQVVFVLAILGAIFKRFEVPVAPVIIGVVLSDLIEMNLRRSITLAAAAKQSVLVYIVTRPLCLILLAVLLVTVIVFFRMGKETRKTISKKIDEAAD